VERVPVTDAELDVFEAWFGDLFDESPDRLSGSLFVVRPMSKQSSFCSLCGAPAVGSHQRLDGSKFSYCSTHVVESSRAIAEQQNAPPANHKRSAPL